MASRPRARRAPLALLTTLLSCACSSGTDEQLAEPSESGAPGQAGSPRGDDGQRSSESGTSAEPGSPNQSPQSVPPESEPGSEAPAQDQMAQTMPEDALAAMAVFDDPDSDFSTIEVHDADRQVFYFDAEAQAMVRSDTGDQRSGWMTDGNDLARGGVFGRFMIRFGTEEGQRRAYFTEVNPPTICNLELNGPEQLQIYATSERPPQ